MLQLLQLGGHTGVLRGGGTAFSTRRPREVALLEVFYVKKIRQHVPSARVVQQLHNL